MKRGYHKKFLTRNQLYRRFTNRGKGFTPKKIDFTIYNSWDRNGVDSELSRIYHITYNSVTPKEEYKPRDLVFDTFSFRNPEELIAISSSLPAEDIAMVFGVEGQIFYYFPFIRKKHHSLSSYKDTYLRMLGDKSSMFYPGFYFVNKRWFIAETSSTRLSSLVRINKETFTEYLSISDIDVSVYIPFHAVKTPVLQAYVPLCVNIGFEASQDYGIQRIVEVDGSYETEEVILDTYGDCYWMGKTVNFNPTKANRHTYGRMFSISKFEFLKAKYIVDEVKYYFINDLSLDETDLKFYLFPHSLINTYIEQPYYKGRVSPEQRFTIYLTKRAIYDPEVDWFSSLKRIYEASDSQTYGSYDLFYGKKDTNLAYICTYTCEDFYELTSTGFNQHVKEAMKKLAVPVGEFFDSF